MNLSTPDQIPQIIAWFLALAEFILALYVLLLNARHTANRHISVMLLFFSTNAFAMGSMIGATSIEQATWPSHLLAATTPAITPALLLTSIALLKPTWLQGRRRGARWSIYALCLLPSVLLGMDLELGTRLYYTGLDPETYTGGFAFLPEYADGSLFLVLWISFYASLALTVALQFFVVLREKETTPLVRRLAWLLLVTSITVTGVEVALLDELGIVRATLITNTAYTLAYGYAAFKQMISERRLQQGRLQTRLTAIVLVITVPILVSIVALVTTRAEGLIKQVAVQQQEIGLLMALWQFQQISWTILAVGVVMLLLLAWLTMHQAFRPIKALTDTVAAIAAGDLTRVAPVKSSDEIGVLARAFNEMTAQLRDLIGSLERRVTERTTELTAANEQLQNEIAERKRVEAALRRSEQRFRNIFEHSPIAIYRTTPEGHILMANQALVSMLGYSSFEELSQLNLEEEGFSADVPRSEFKRRIEKDGQVVGLESIWIKQDGSTLFVRESARAIRDEDGNTLYYEGAAEDISEHKRTEQRIQRRNKELEALREVLLAVTAQLELGELLQSVVDRGCRLLDVKAGGIYLVDKSQGNLELVICLGYNKNYTGVRLAPGEGIAGRVLQSGTPLTVENYSHWEGRAPTWEAAQITGALAVPLKHREKIVGVMEFNEIARDRSFDEHDVWLANLFAHQVAIAIENARLFEAAQHELAERRRAEEELRRAKKELEKRNTRLEALYRVGQVVNSELDMDAILDHLTDEAMRVTRATHGQVLVVREKERDFVRRSLRGFSPEQANRARTAPLPLIEGINGRVYKTHQTVLVDDVRDESGYYPLIPATRTELAVPIIRKGKVLGNLDLQSPEIGAFRDVDQDYLQALSDQVAVALTNARLFEEAQQEIAERKRAEAALKTYAAKLERSNRELEEFAYVASHDLQEPLRKVIAFGDLLKRRNAEALDDRGRDYLGRMRDAAQRMQNLINSLLTYSRVMTRAQPFVPVDLDQIVHETLSDLSIRIEQMDAQVQVGELPTIEADPTQMHQLFQNLVSNALKYHRPNVPPVVEVRGNLLKGQTVHPSKDNAGDQLCQIMIKDNGIGFDEQYTDRIFQVFRRLHGRDQYEGTGVGLAICRKIVERHGGTITAKSKPEQGATFVVTLPAKQQGGKLDNE